MQALFPNREDVQSKTLLALEELHSTNNDSYCTLCKNTLAYMSFRIKQEHYGRVDRLGSKPNEVDYRHSSFVLKLYVHNTY